MDAFLRSNVPVLKALSDETRLKILLLLSRKKMCSKELLEYVHITQPALSYHMRILMENEIVTCEHKASNIYFQVNDQTAETLKYIAATLKQEELKAISNWP
ncbi:MAG: metalloregulator ArsR/SmtB family transcription factor [Eubacteriales bacterium]|nr:metalloregulator ArsR/SmtB family transcription factor [Eubacteriales bacterium]